MVGVGLDNIKSLYLQYLWKEGVFETLPPTPRPIEVGVVRRPPGSWTPAELRGKFQKKDLITLPSTEEGDEVLRTFLHELGHALFTPTPSQNPKFWEEYQELGEVLNVVEDLRIEGKMSEILGFDLGKFPPSEKPTANVGDLLSIMVYLHLGYKVECPEGGEKLIKRAERLLRRLYKASAWSSLRLARYFKKKFPYLCPPKPIELGGAKDIRQEAPQEYESLEEPGGFLSGKEKRGGGWFEHVPPPELPPAIIKLARELFKAPEPEWVPSSSGRLVVSSYLRGDEEPFVRQEELPTIHPLIVVDTSGSMFKVQEEVRMLLYALYKAGLKGSVLLVKNGTVKKVPVRDAYKASFNGMTEGLWVCARFINSSPLTIIISDLALSHEDGSKVRKSFSKKPNVYWVYWGSYKGEFLKNALRLEIPRSRVIAEDTLEGCLKKLSRLLRG